jgi:hypothetical protein
MVRLEGLGQQKKSNNLIGNQTRDLPACSTVPQPTTLPRDPSHLMHDKKIISMPEEILQH